MENVKLSQITAKGITLITYYISKELKKKGVLTLEIVGQVTTITVLKKKK